MIIMYYQFYILFALPSLILSRNEDYNLIDLSDILNVDYMPGSLLILENPDENTFENNSVINNVSQHQGTFHDALNTMNYHRKMMNEYLCRSYVSEQILSEMRSSRIRRRLGNPVENINAKIGSPFAPLNVSYKNNLIDDEGSVNYQEWLKKSATLEDIYRHYDAQNRDALDQREGVEDNEEYDTQVAGYTYQQPNTQGLPSKFGQTGVGGNYPSYGYGGGHVQPSSVGSGGGGLYGFNSGGHSGYGGGGSVFGGGDHTFEDGTSGHSEHEYSSYHEHSPKHHGGHDKDKLSDLFDIALTALAFLSFGMFIVQVIICISMGTTTTTAMTVMPMSMAVDTAGIIRGDMSGGGTGGGTISTFEDTENINEKIHKGGSVVILGEDEEEEEEDREDLGEGYIRIGRGAGTRDVSNIKIERSSKGSKGGTADEMDVEESASADADVRDHSRIRGKRAIPIISQPNNELLNELARRVLVSIEAALVAHQDGGNCLRRALCENNVYSRTVDTNQRYWIPVWSLGMSWLSGRLIPEIPKATSMLDTLKASILGLGRADCEFMYRCDLTKQREKRRKRRKRSSTAK